jgi:hypothetical protein
MWWPPSTAWTMASFAPRSAGPTSPLFFATRASAGARSQSASAKSSCLSAPSKGGGNGGTVGV